MGWGVRADKGDKTHQHVKHEIYKHRLNLPILKKLSKVRAISPCALPPWLRSRSRVIVCGRRSLTIKRDRKHDNGINVYITDLPLQ